MLYRVVVDDRVIRGLEYQTFTVRLCYLWRSTTVSCRWKLWHSAPTNWRCPS